MVLTLKGLGIKESVNEGISQGDIKVIDTHDIPSFKEPKHSYELVYVTKPRVLSRGGGTLATVRFLAKGKYGGRIVDIPLDALKQSDKFEKYKVRFKGDILPKFKKFIKDDEVKESVNEAINYYKSKRKSDDLYYKKVGNKWYKSLASKKGKVKWYVVKFPQDLDKRDMSKINKNKLPSGLKESVNEAEMIHVLTKDIGKKKMKDLEQYLWHVLDLEHNKDFRLSSNGKILSVNVDKINSKSIQNIKKRYGVDLRESVNEGGMGILTSDQADILQAIVMKNKNKNSKAILNIVMKDPMFKGEDKKEMLGYIEGARQFVKYMRELK